jgi:IS4 transposase
VLWQAYFRIELMCADALRTRRQVLLGNEQQDDKYQNEGDVAEIVFDGAVRSHTGEPFSSRETDTSHKKDEQTLLPSLFTCGIPLVGELLLVSPYFSDPLHPFLLRRGYNISPPTRFNDS